MRGLWPRSPRSPIPYNLDLSSVSACSLFCGDLHRLSPGCLRCSSKISLAKSGCCGQFFAGDSLHPPPPPPRAQAPANSTVAPPSGAWTHRNLQLHHHVVLGQPGTCARNPAQMHPHAPSRKKLARWFNVCVPVHPRVTLAYRHIKFNHNDLQ